MRSKKGRLPQGETRHLASHNLITLDKMREELKAREQELNSKAFRCDSTAKSFGKIYCRLTSKNEHLAIQTKNQIDLAEDNAHKMITE